MENKYKYLFLDRDGVINEERPNDYVKTEDEFVFIEKTTDAIAILSQRFEEIFIVTNQRGVGRGIMSQEKLDQIHRLMTDKIVSVGGNVSGIYVCPDICSSSINRKPNIGMAFRIQADFPQVDFSESIMVGNSKSDVLFGKKAGMHTVLVGDKYNKSDAVYDIADRWYKDLYSFAEAMIENKNI